MALKIVAGIFAAALMLVYMAPVVLRLKEVSLWIIALLGCAMMLIDLWQSLRSKDD
jgi:hypothetical protein